MGLTPVCVTPIFMSVFNCTGCGHLFNFFFIILSKACVWNGGELCSGSPVHYFLCWWMSLNSIMCQVQIQAEKWNIVNCSVDSLGWKYVDVGCVLLAFWHLSYASTLSASHCLSLFLYVCLSVSSLPPSSLPHWPSLDRFLRISGSLGHPASKLHLFYYLSPCVTHTSDIFLYADLWSGAHILDYILMSVSWILLG